MNLPEIEPDVVKKVNSGNFWENFKAGETFRCYSYPQISVNSFFKELACPVNRCVIML